MPFFVNQAQLSTISSQSTVRTMTFKSPPSPDGSVSDMRFTTPLGARFDPGKSTRKAQAYKFKVGDVVEVRDDPFQPWRRGTVAALQADGRPRVRRADSDVGSAFPFNEFCRWKKYSVGNKSSSSQKVMNFPSAMSIAVCLAVARPELSGSRT